MSRRLGSLLLPALALALPLAGCDDDVMLLPDAGPRMDARPGDAGGAMLLCDNGERDGDETAVDCGGSCPPCPAGENCAGAEDCESRVCERGRCLVPNCRDGVQNGDETGADCGGDCGLCPGGEACTSNDQCLSGRCRGGMCTMSGCEDGVQNGTETDVDCGGDLCPPCSAGFACDRGQDCESLLCRTGECTEAACNDGIQNQDETSVDCGGSSCPGCRSGLSCQIDADCESDRCFMGGCVSCSDRIRNAEETDVDCGGGGLCPACGDGGRCVVDADCRSLNCADTDGDGAGDTCQSCEDGVQNGDETDVDCGGSVCAACPAGAACLVDGDCDLGSCSPTTNTCVNCLDNILNQDESDVDCGGSVCLGCGPGFACRTGADCASGTCTAGACVGLSSSPTFQVTNLTNLACAVVDHNAITGDDRGGIGLSDQTVMYTGDTATGVYNLDLSGGTALFPPTSLVGTHRDVMITNARDGQIYLLADSGTPLPRGGGTITELLPMNADGTPSATGAVTLSTPIVATSPTFSSNVGLFSGYDRIVIHDGSAAWSIALPSGTVTNLGAMPTPTRRTCENWAYWGIAETDGANTNLVLVENSTRINKVAVPSGASVGSFPFTNLADMCSFAPSLPNSRWYWHHENSSQFISAGSENVGYCDAVYDTTGGNFRVTSLSGTGCMALNYMNLIGDDRSGVAVSPSHVYVSGDGGLGRWNLDLSGGVSSGGTGIQHDALVSDLRAGRAYLLAGTAGALGRSGGTVTRLLALDPVTGLESGAEIALSTSITLPSSNVGLFSGWNRVILHDGARAWRIELPAGTVTDLGPMRSPPHRSCETWAYWGIAEFYGGAEHIIAVVDSTTITRYAVPSAAVENSWTFTNLADMCSIAFSPRTNRWYFHHEGTSEFTAGLPGFPSEILGYCRGVYGNP